MKAVGTILSAVVIFGTASLLSSCNQSGEPQNATLDCAEVKGMAWDVAMARMDGVQRIDLLAQVQTATQSGPIHPELGRQIVEAAYTTPGIYKRERVDLPEANNAKLFAERMFTECRRLLGSANEVPGQSTSAKPAGSQIETGGREDDGSAAPTAPSYVNQEQDQDFAPPAATPADLKALAEHEAEIKTIQAAAEEDARAQLAAVEKEEAAARCAATLGQPDREAQLAASMAPRYPPAAARAGVSGNVEVEVDYDSDGKVRDLKVVSSSRDRDLDRSASEAARSWQIDPGVLGGCPRGAGKLRSTVRFNLGEPVVVG